MRIQIASAHLNCKCNLEFTVDEQALKIKIGSGTKNWFMDQKMVQGPNFGSEKTELNQKMAHGPKIGSGSKNWFM